MKRILVLDDDAAILRTLEDALETLNYTVKAIDNSNHFFNEICVFQPDLLLLDFMLSSSNGGALCHQIKTNPEFSGLPIIMMSGYNDVFELVVKAGADDFIQKPFDLAELDERIENCIRNNSKRNSLDAFV